MTDQSEPLDTEPADVECPACGDIDAVPLGSLGDVPYCRCRACGITFNA